MRTYVLIKKVDKKGFFTQNSVDKPVYSVYNSVENKRISKKINLEANFGFVPCIIKNEEDKGAEI